MAGGPGFEPGFSESESDVLPLDDPPIREERLDPSLSASRTGSRDEPFAIQPFCARLHERRG